MDLSRNFLTEKRKYGFALILLMFISVICVAFSIEDSNDFDITRREVLLRKIGHELLLQSGDSTSRVLPVQKISDNEYRIRFENDFTFQTESLVNTTQRLLAKDPLARDYVVNVLNCGNASVAFGYAMSKNKKDDIVGCIRRRQPIACYMIDIKFKPRGVNTLRNKYFLGSITILAFIGYVFFSLVKSKRALPNGQLIKIITLGSVLFDPEKRQLIINKEIIDLTRTETRLLLIFASTPNEIIDRKRLQKEIWEDEGVIVGRSLDMFISKLRKKLEFAPNIKIVVIRSKGYMLEVST